MLVEEHQLPLLPLEAWHEYFGWDHDENLSTEGMLRGAAVPGRHAA